MIFLRAAALLAGFLIFAAPPAQAGDVYAVKNVAVSATASSATKARQNAILQGYKKALARLLRRLTLPEDWQRLPKISGRRARKLALQLEPSRVRTSQRQYKAELSIHFDPKRVREILRGAEIPYSEIQARPALLLPLYQTKDSIFLWEESNLWRSAFAAQDLDNIPVPFLLPVGDVSDIRAVSPESVRRADASILLPFAENYEARHILIAQAIAQEDSRALRVALLYLRPDGNPGERVSFFLADDEGTPDLLARAVQTALRITSDGWKRRALIAHDAPRTRRLQAQYESMEEWQRILTRLKTVPLLENHVVRLIGRRSALIDIRFRGAPETFALALAQKEIRLVVGDEKSEDSEEDGGEKEQENPDADPWTMTLEK